MKKRILGAAIVLIILIGSLLLGGEVFTITMTIAALFGLKELIDIKYKNNNIVFIKLISYFLLGLFLLNNTFFAIDRLTVFILITLSLIIPIVFYNNKEKYNINDAFYFIGIVSFLAFAFETIIDMREISIFKCIYIFIISFIPSCILVLLY